MSQARANPLAWVMAAAAIVALIVAGAIGYRRYTDDYTVSVRPDTGRAVAEVVRATFDGASDLRVSTLSGTVQSVADDPGFGGMLPSKRVVKVPFSVDYFVDLSAMGPEDFRWDAERRTLIATVPGVRAAAPNIDEARATLVRDEGVFITRAAMERLQRQASQRAVATTEAAATTPERIAAARANARRALTRLLSTPLATAGLGEVRVEVRFAGEGGQGSRWDVSRSIADVLADPAR